MKLSLFLFSLLFSLSGFAMNVVDDGPTCYTIEKWNKRIQALKGFDEIRMTYGQRVLRVPKKVTKDGIEYETRMETDELIGSVKDIDDSDVFVQLLQFKPNVAEMSHGCHGLFNLTFYKQGTVVGGFHYAHGRYWGPLTDDAQAAMNRWLEGKGFSVLAIIKNDARE